MDNRGVLPREGAQIYDLALLDFPDEVCTAKSPNYVDCSTNEYWTTINIRRQADQTVISHPYAQNYNMPLSYNPADLPAETIERNDQVWTRNKYDKDAYQWVRELDEDEYNWDGSEVNIVGADVPMRIVSLQLQNDEWHVKGAETGGPKYHRPGFTELISGEFADTFSDADNAFDAVHDYIERLS